VGTQVAQRTLVRQLSFPASRRPNVREITTFETGRVWVTCLRGGEYIYADGLVETAHGASRPPALRFAQLVDIRARSGAQTGPRGYTFREVTFSDRRAFTGPDGSVFGLIGFYPPDLKSIDSRMRTEFLAFNLTYSLRHGAGDVTFVATTPQTNPPRSFPIYGVGARGNRAIGSYGCPAVHPGCAVGTPAVYYAYSDRKADTYSVDTLVTITPRQDRIARPWPIVPRDRAASAALEIRGVVLDDKRCFVLLQPNLSLAANHVDHQPKLDLLIANCRFGKDRLEFDAPQAVARKQGSFASPKLSLHGQFLVITEEVQMQPEDWPLPAAEQVAWEQKGDCIHILRPEAGRGAVLLNSFCAQGRGASTKFIVSPDGNYVAIDDGANPIIVGREYRNEGIGPGWLISGGRP
jgi:hypothetical protein